MRTLHINVGFQYTSVYKELFRSLKNLDVNQSVYVPKRKDNIIESPVLEDSSFKFYSNKIIKNYDKVLYFTKIKRMVMDVEQNIDLTDVSVIHAHSLYSDGAVAYELYKKSGIPYIVAIRSTDFNQYYKYGKHLYKYAEKILKNAINIIVLSKAYQEDLKNKFTIDNYSRKIEIIPNGIIDFWHKPKNIMKNFDDKINLIFVGRLIERKNLGTVIDVVNEMHQMGYSIHLDIIGDGPLASKIHQDEKSYIKYHGKVNNLDELEKLYLKNDILLVPSFSETFGLVYIESMACGTPVIYTKNQGIDGYFEEGSVGYAVNPTDLNSIIEKIILIKENYEVMSDNCVKYSKDFNWNIIGKKYKQIYNNIV